MTQARNLNLHEFQSKALMEKYNVRVQRWRLVRSAEEAEEQAKDLGIYYTLPFHSIIIHNFFLAAETTVVKAQIHAGGRGKGRFSNGYKGGVKLCQKFVIFFQTEIL